MKTESDRRTLHATLCEIGWAQPHALAGDTYVVALNPDAPPLRDVIVTLDAPASRLAVHVRFLPPAETARLDELMVVLMFVNGEIRAGAFAWDESQGSVFFRHTVELDGKPLAADDVRHAVLLALETVAEHAVALAHALTGRKAA